VHNEFAQVERLGGRIAVAPLCRNVLFSFYVSTQLKRFMKGLMVGKIKEIMMQAREEGKTVEQPETFFFLVIASMIGRGLCC
jgi:hypothetical protein